MGSSRDILPRHTKSGKQPKVALSREWTLATCIAKQALRFCVSLKASVGELFIGSIYSSLVIRGEELDGPSEEICSCRSHAPDVCIHPKRKAPLIKQAALCMKSRYTAYFFHANSFFAYFFYDDSRVIPRLRPVFSAFQAHSIPR